jgi:alkylated DNA nucleotide flippase Atl1
VDADDTDLKTLLEGVKQFVAPRYQRRYIWTQPQWEALWRQVERQHGAYLAIEEAQEAGTPLPPLSTHFLGSFVLAPQPGPAAQLTRHQIVDGQQRLTTVSVLLAALRDLISETSSAEDGERIHNTYLVNQYRQGEDHSKILLTETDRADLFGATVARPADPTGRIGSAYSFFRNRLEVALEGAPDLDLTKLETAIVTRLAVVEITAGAADNVHRIFQTLNASGVRLEQVDLLRNHFFMLLPTRGDAVYGDLWLPMESALGTAGLDDFFFTDLVRRRGNVERYARHDAYPVYQEELEPIENDEDAIVELLIDIRQRAEVFRQIADPDLALHENVIHRLKRLAEWGTATAGPLLLEILLRLAGNQISSEDAERALLYVESYLVRRLLLKIPTNNLNRIFSEVPASLPAEGSVADALRTLLSVPGRYWPTDEDVHARIASEEFYRSQRPAQRQFVLRRLEEALPHEVPPDWTQANLTLEHVMPQTLTEEWFGYLAELEAQRPANEREDPLELHARLAHTLGNISLTAYNPELGAKSFDEKKQLMFDNGPLELNRQLLETPLWGRDEVEARSRVLGEIAIALWPGPGEGAAGAGAVDTWALVDAALTALPVGRWTTYGELTELSNIPAVEIRARLHQGSYPHAARRVMTSDGRIDAVAPWAADNLHAYRQQLVADGILAAASASEALAEVFISAAELSDLIGEA